MQLPTLPVALLFISLACFGKAQFSTTSYPETTTDFDETSTVATTPSEEESWTRETTDVDSLPRRTTGDSAEGTTSTGDELATTTDSIATFGTTDVTPAEDKEGEPSDGQDPVESGVKKESVPEEEGASDGTTTKPERKPVVEPLFIKKYWPLLCFKTKCDRRHSSPAIPEANAPEVRTDMEESRSSNELIRALAREIVQSDDPTAVNSGEEDDKSDETTETDDTSEPEKAAATTTTTTTAAEDDTAEETAAEEHGAGESKESDESTEEASTAGTTKKEDDDE